MKKLLLLLLILLPGWLFAQKHNGILKGIVYDSTNDYALQMSSVSVYKQADSSIVEFQVSNSLGEFELKNLPLKTKLFYLISHTGYLTVHKNFELDSATQTVDLKKIMMRERAAGELDEVVVKGVLPIRMNGDTLEINPDAFKMDSNAVVEEMLLRVPGLTIWGDGSITMNGQRVEKFHVNGKPFFGGSAETATQNLPKNAIEKIQLYQEKDQTKISATDQKKDSLYTMNIKLKDSKNKGLFGKVGAGYGTDDRYSGDAVIQGYTAKTQAGLALGINNINKEEGTGENAFQENTFKSVFRNYYYGRGGGGGITRRTYGNLKVQHSFSEAENGQFFSRLTGGYGYLNLLSNQNSNTTNVQNIGTYKQSYISKNENENNNTNNNIRFEWDNRKKWGNYISLSGNYSQSNSTSENKGSTDAYKNDSVLVSSSNRVSSSVGRGDNAYFNGHISANDWQMRDDPRKNFSMYFGGGYNNSMNNTHTIDNFISYIDTIPSRKIDRRYNNDNNNYNANIGFNYDGFRNLIFGIYNFYKINISLKNELSFSKSNSDTRVFDLDTINNDYISNTKLTNLNSQTNFTYKPALGFNKSFSKYIWGRYYYWASVAFDFRYKFLNQKNESSFLNRNLERNFVCFSPQLNFNFSFQKEDAYRINAYMYGDRDADLPSVDNLYPIVDDANRYSIVVGNPNLKPTYANYLNLNLEASRAKQSAKTNYGFRFSISPQVRRDAIGDSVIYDPSGGSTRYLINVDQQKNFNTNLNLNLSTKIDKTSTINFSYDVSLNKTTQPGYINRMNSFSESNSLSNGLNITYNLIDKFNITLGQRVSVNKSEQTGQRSSSSKIKNYATNSNLNYFITKAITFNTSLSYQSNIAANGNAVEATIWNASTLYRFMKQKAELKLSAFDILRQNKYIRNFVSANSATTTVSNGLQQYFMVSFSYYPRKFGGSGKSSSGTAVMISR